MKLGRVIGNVEGVIKHPAYANTKLMVVQPVDEHLKPNGRTHPAIDTVGAGEGDLVLLVEEGKAAQDMLGMKRIPVRTLIVGIIDSVDVMARGNTGRSRVA
ncbi:MAG: EutN/CcmL family microcompartment protein [Abitibacteriaceae bacterium]|nr:EutN/CcmL family microcompartment protein [Abditibacteriaceae bacterium]MBV9866041.1 EutN/CcmL family microcompartment protein [Abditibacteriaceae bacterium]